MAFEFKIISHPLAFKFEAGTSRGKLNDKPSYFIHLTSGNKEGWGEVSLIPKLSPDIKVDVEAVCSDLLLKLQGLGLGTDIHAFLDEHCLSEWPAIRFGIETAWMSLHAKDPFVLFENSFTAGAYGIPINGLIWMGDYDTMQDRIERKLAEGFRCIKLKIGAIDWHEELKILKALRLKYTEDELMIRVDANGAFTREVAVGVLNELRRYKVHSIEQPIKAGQVEAMSMLCYHAPCPIALDEELIGIQGRKERERLLRDISPQYIILKPSLLGGLKETQEWIELAEANGIGWWITSALESNIGLNAIAQFAATFDSNMYQGLGTGGLYHNNLASPLEIRGEKLYFDPRGKWVTEGLEG